MQFTETLLYVRVSAEFKKREFGMRNIIEYSNIFDEVLGKQPKAAALNAQNVVAMYLPCSAAGELEKLAQVIPFSDTELPQESV